MRTVRSLSLSQHISHSPTDHNNTAAFSPPASIGQRQDNRENNATELREPKGQSCLVNKRYDRTHLLDKYIRTWKLHAFEKKNLIGGSRLGDIAIQTFLVVECVMGSGWKWTGPCQVQFYAFMHPVERTKPHGNNINEVSSTNPSLSFTPTLLVHTPTSN